MNREDYISQNEMKDIYEIGGARISVMRLIETTKDKEWHKRLKTCETLLRQTINERTNCVTDVKRRKLLWKRIERSKIYWTTADGVADYSPPDVVKVTVPEEPLYLIASAAMTKCCTNCTDKEWQKCPLRKAFTDCALPTMVGQPEGMCEFKIVRENKKKE